MWFTENLVAILGKYDPEELVYIGNWSEDNSNIQVHARMAYGGGGYAISRPLAKLLSETMDKCLPRFDALYGQDSRVASCVAELGAKFTREAGFHQFDLKGDLTGILEAHPQAPVGSLHHLQMLNPVFPNESFDVGIKRLLQASTILHTAVLQQFVALNRQRQWTFSIAHGFSVRWWAKNKLTPWVRKVEITFDRFQDKQHNGPHDWTFDSRRKHPLCKHYDVFYYTKPSTDKKSLIYTRHENPRCTSFPGVNAIQVELSSGEPCAIGQVPPLNRDMTMTALERKSTRVEATDLKSGQSAECEVTVTRTDIVDEVQIMQN